MATLSKIFVEAVAPCWARRAVAESGAAAAGKTRELWMTEILSAGIS